MKLVSFCLALLLIGTTGNVWAGKFYKWTDDEGVTHYTLTPPPEGKESKSVRTFNSASSDQADALQRLDKQRQKAAAAIEKKKKMAEQESGDLPEEDQVKKDCAAHRKNLETMRNNARVKQVDPKTGEARYLTPEEKTAAEQQAQKALDLCEKLLKE